MYSKNKFTAHYFLEKFIFSIDFFDIVLFDMDLILIELYLKDLTTTSNLDLSVMNFEVAVSSATGLGK